MVTDDDVEEITRRCRVGRPSASTYFLMVPRWIPNSRSIARRDIPLRLAFRIAFHRSFWRNVGLRAEAAAALQALATLSMIILGSLSSSGRECNGSRVAVQRLPKPSTPEVGTVTLAERRWPLRRNTGLGAADHRPQGRRRLGEVPFQRNKPGLRLGIVTGQGGVKLGDHRDAGVFRKGHHLGNVNAVPIVPQLFRQGRGHPRRRPS